MDRKTEEAVRRNREREKEEDGWKKGKREKIKEKLNGGREGQGKRYNTLYVNANFWNLFVTLRYAPQRTSEPAPSVSHWHQSTINIRNYKCINVPTLPTSRTDPKKEKKKKHTQMKINARKKQIVETLWRDKQTEDGGSACAGAVWSSEIARRPLISSGRCSGSQPRHLWPLGPADERTKERLGPRPGLRRTLRVHNALQKQNRRAFGRWTERWSTYAARLF